VGERVEEEKVREVKDGEGNSPVNIRFNPKKIARKGFSTVSGTILCGE